jgi:hypothetical protein
MINMKKAIYFDMDGTIADFYGVPNWLRYLCESNPHPYEVAAPLLNMSLLARLLNRLQREGWHIGIVSWTSKTGSPAFNSATAEAKMDWLNQHLHSVHWDEINIVPYGTPKQTVVMFSEGILFDDEAPNREAWEGTAYDVENIIEILKGLF